MTPSIRSIRSSRPTRPTRSPGPSGRGAPAASERGVVTAELALALPTLLAVTTGLVWLVAVGVGQVRMVDAARETARALARGDDEAAAVAVGQRVAPDGARISVTTSGDQVVVTAEGRIDGPGGLFRELPGADLRAEAVALTEGTAAGGGP